MSTAVAEPTAAIGKSSPVWILLASALLSLPFGLVAVATVIPFNVAALVIWAALFGWTTLRLSRAERRPLAMSMAAIQMLVLLVVVTAATLAPVKTTEKFLDRTISLPHEQMTLAELAGDPNGPRPDWLRFSMTVSVPEDEREKVIRLGRSPLTVREFVAAVESQSTLRRQFSHCGNGSTVLWGGDCCFGLHLRRPPEHH